MPRYGEIVLVSKLVDPRGRNPKDRPAVIVTRTEEIDSGAPLVVVAITTTLPEPLPDDYVSLPWSRPRHPRTGLNERNAAVCHWLAVIEEATVIRTIGQVPTPQLARIDEILRRLAGGGPFSEGP
jgi:mRNA-degrading endonuclease toxin of MazEF toxin-antitoxin module